MHICKDLLANIVSVRSSCSSNASNSANLVIYGMCFNKIPPSSPHEMGDRHSSCLGFKDVTDRCFVYVIFQTSLSVSGPQQSILITLITAPFSRGSGSFFTTLFASFPGLRNKRSNQASFSCTIVSL